SSKEIPAEQKEEFIYHIQNSSEMLLSLVDDIIDLAKIEANQLKINKTECSPVKLLKNIAANFEAYKNRMEKEHLEIKLMLPNEEMPFRTDSFRLKQILINLMSNAVKFTENGSVEMGLLVSEQRKIRFYVQDTGIGMTNEEIRTVFNRFERTKLSEEKKISGTGLGLAISKSLVELLGGEMWVSSEPGKGSCFSFELPYLRVPAGIAEQIKETKEQSYNWKGKTILIAEDNHVNFDFLKHSLELTGANIIHAENGKQAVQAISFHPEIDIVLMDLKMPKLGGLEATMQIKEIQPYLPVIAQTAFAMEGDRNRCISAGCDDYITKPINIENLKAKIAQFIDRKTAWQTNKSNNLQSTNATENLGKANFTIEHKNKDVDL
ncbi:MAG: response regulator, partial [Bacteroidales bacterium]|nr:response regulator [Bacteroidales bacterium]MBN2819130.1 response regulator [Bacteroidales bacterium]